VPEEGEERGSSILHFNSEIGKPFSLACPTRLLGFTHARTFPWDTRGDRFKWHLPVARSPSPLRRGGCIMKRISLRLVSRRSCPSLNSSMHARCVNRKRKGSQARRCNLTGERWRCLPAGGVRRTGTALPGDTGRSRAIPSFSRPVPPPPVPFPPRLTASRNEEKRLCDSPVRCCFSRSSRASSSRFKTLLSADTMERVFSRLEDYRCPFWRSSCE